MCASRFAFGCRPVAAIRAGSDIARGRPAGTVVGSPARGCPLRGGHGNVSLYTAAQADLGRPLSWGDTERGHRPGAPKASAGVWEPSRTGSAAPAERGHEGPMGQSANDDRVGCLDTQRMSAHSYVAHSLAQTGRGDRLSLRTNQECGYGRDNARDRVQSSHHR